MSKMAELHNDIRQAEALMGDDQTLAHRICESFAKVVRGQDERIKELEDMISSLVEGIESHGAEKWMPHKVERAKELLVKNKWSLR